MVKLFINDVEQSNFIFSAPTKDTLDEELDQLNFQIKSTSRKDLKKNDRIVYKILQGNVEILSKVFCLFGLVETWEGEYWLYQISCVSPTKLLENIIINGMAETYPVATLYSQMDRVRQKINFQQAREYGNNAISLQFDGITISNGNASLIYTTETGEFLWSGQVNAREIFNDMLDKVDCLIIGYDFSFSNGNITTINLKAEKREKKGTQLVNSANDIESGGLDDVKELVKGLSITRNSELACGNIISLITNAVCKDNVQQSYLPSRNDDMTIDDASDWHIITQEPIYSLNKVYAYVSVRTYIKVWRDNGGVLEEQFYSSTGQPNSNPTPLFMLMPYDITNYIVEKDVFDSMSVKEQKKHLYFKRGEKGIYGLYKLYKENPLWSSKALDNICKSMTPSIVVNSNGVLTLDYCGNPPMLLDMSGRLVNVNTNWPSSAYNYPFHYSTSGLKEADAVKTFDRTGLTLDDIEVEHALFSVNYQPYCDSVVKIEKDNVAGLEANSKNLSVLKNQNDRTVDASKYFDSQESFINRMGNKEMTIDCMVDLTQTYSQIKSLWNLGDYFTLGGNDWTITQREIENYSMDLLKVKYKLSKDYNASNVDIQLKRDKRLYGIPLNQYVDRYILVKINSLTNWDKIFIKCWDDFTLNQTEQTNDSQEGYCVFEAIKIGNNNKFHKVVRCKDNYAVDIERTKYSSTIVNVNLRYCDTNGYKEDMNVYACTNDRYNSLNISNYSRLPFIPLSEGNDISIYGSTLTLTGIKKDKMERLIFVFYEG